MGRVDQHLAHAYALFQGPQQIAVPLPSQRVRVSVPHTHDNQSLQEHQNLRVTSLAHTKTIPHCSSPCTTTLCRSSREFASDDWCRSSSMNGCGGRWFERLAPAARWHLASAIHSRALPCSTARSFSHGSYRLSRVTRPRPISSPGNAGLEGEARLISPEKCVIQESPDDTPWNADSNWARKEMKDAEGRTYCKFVSHQVAASF